MWYISYSRYFADIDKDNQKAKVWLEKATKQGHREATFDLAVLHAHEKNYIEGNKWICIAKAIGNTLIFDLDTLKGFNKLITPKEDPPLFSQADLEKGTEIARSWLSATAL